MQENKVRNAQEKYTLALSILTTMQAVQSMESGIAGYVLHTVLGILSLISVLELLAHDSKGKGVPDVIDNLRTLARALFGHRPKK